MRTQACNQRRELSYRPSRYLVVVYAIVTLLMLGAFAFLWPAPPVQALAFCFMVVALWSMGRQLNLNRQLQRLVVAPDHLSLVFDGRPMEVEIVGNPLVTPYLIALSCRPGANHNGKIYRRRWRPPIHLALLPDSLSAADHHYLRTVLLAGRL